MTEQLHHDDLTGASNRRLSGHLHMVLADLVAQTHPVPVLTALAALFTQVCAVADVDPADTLMQVQEALERGELSLREDASFDPRGHHIRN